VQAPIAPFDGQGTVWTKPGRHFHLNVYANSQGDRFVVWCGLGGEPVGQPVTKAMVHPAKK
jgi:hypothetical protein